MSYEPLDPAEYKRQWALFKALHCAHPVLIDGKSDFIHSMHVGPNGGGIEMTVYIASARGPVAAGRVEIKTTTN